MAGAAYTKRRKTDPTPSTNVNSNVNGCAHFPGEGDFHSPGGLPTSFPGLGKRPGDEIGDWGTPIQGKP